MYFEEVGKTDNASRRIRKFTSIGLRHTIGKMSGVSCRLESATQMYLGLWKNTEHSTASAYRSSSVHLCCSGTEAFSPGADVGPLDEEQEESIELVLIRVTASRRATR